MNMADIVSDQDKSASLSQDTIYAELHTEMRFYRDKSMEMQRWYSTIMLGLIVGSISLASMNLDVNVIPYLRAIMFVPVIALNVFVNYWVFYTDRRYHELRECVRRFERVGYSNSRQNYKFKPHHILLSLNTILLFVFFAILLLF